MALGRAEGRASGRRSSDLRLPRRLPGPPSSPVPTAPQPPAPQAAPLFKAPARARPRESQQVDPPWPGSQPGLGPRSSLLPPCLTLGAVRPAGLPRAHPSLRSPRGRRKAPVECVSYGVDASQRGRRQALTILAFPSHPGPRWPADVRGCPCPWTPERPREFPSQANPRRPPDVPPQGPHASGCPSGCGFPRVVLARQSCAHSRHQPAGTQVAVPGR